MDPKEYVDFNFFILNDIPKYTVKLKKIFTDSKKYPKGDNDMPLSPSKAEYFIYFVGEKDGMEVYNFVKLFFNKKYGFNYAVENKLINEDYIDLIEKYFTSIDLKMKENHLKVTSSAEYREKLSKASNRELQSQIKKEWHQSKDNREKFLAATQTVEVKKKREEKFKIWLENGGHEILIIASNKPERKKKISDNSKKMWEKAKNENDKEKLSKWYKARFSRNYKLLDYKVNKIEYKFGTFLLNLGIDFLYEELTKLEEGITYPDFLIAEKKIIFECYGDFWHGNPSIYAPDKILFDNIKASEIWEKDKKRVDNLIQKGYKVYYFWETDILKNKETVIEKIKEIINEHN